MDRLAGLLRGRYDGGMFGRAVLAACLTVGSCWGQRTTGFGTGMDGRPIMSLGQAGVKAVVLFFVASDCPISNRTFPEMKRVREEFARRGVRVWFVYPNDGERRDEVRHHQGQFDAGGEAVMDVNGRLTELTGAKATPEAVVLVPAGVGGWQVVYRGRVDDRYVRLGLERPQASRHFAEEALQQLLDGRPIEAAVGELVGCGIVRPKASVR